MESFDPTSIDWTSCTVDLLLLMSTAIAHYDSKTYAAIVHNSPTVSNDKQ